MENQAEFRFSTRHPIGGVEVENSAREAELLIEGEKQ